MDRQIIGSSGPVYCSLTVNLVALPCGDRVKVRTSRNSPSGIPPSQVIRPPGRNSVTFSEKVRWKPPARLAYLWHIYGEREDATTVTIVHRGWERLGARGEELRRGNRQGGTACSPLPAVLPLAMRLDNCYR
jgi:hypothetical protein